MDWFVVLFSLFAVSVCAEDRWVWGDNNVLIPRIPGRVNPQPRHLQPRVTTPAPDITTFRPSIQSPLGRYISSRAHAINSFPPFFPFLPFGGLMGLKRLPVTQTYLQQQKIQQASPQALLSRPPNHALPLPGDGTTKSRVTVDTAFDSVAVLEDEDKYTTLDKHQSEQRQIGPLPRPREEHLGGLDPREVFYADEDLLIIKGGGFNSDKFEEPSQTLDDFENDDHEFGQASHVSSFALPNPDLEYNGNIPAILPPPSSDLELTDHIADQSHYSVFVEAPSRTSSMAIHIPYVYPLDDSRDANRTPDYSLHFGESEQNDNSLYVKRSAQEFPVLQSLSGDTAVNFLEPRPSVNPDAEFVTQDQPRVVLMNQPVSTQQRPQVFYQQPQFVYQYMPVYPYQTVYRQRQPSRVEVYKRPYNQPSRPRQRPKL